MFILKKEENCIYSLCFDDPYKLAMTFLRCQEYYESENLRFYRNKFTIAQYIDWYFQKNGKFNYHEDWVGFNIPSPIIDEVYRSGIFDFNHYDYLMKGIVEYIKSDSNSNHCYLIGYCRSAQDSDVTLKHEITHGRFYIYGNYRTKIENLIAKLPKELCDTLYQKVMNIGYAQSSVVDEIQAFAVCNDEDRIWPEEKPPELSELFNKIKEINKEFFGE